MLHRMHLGNSVSSCHKQSFDRHRAQWFQCIIAVLQPNSPVQLSEKTSHNQTSLLSEFQSVISPGHGPTYEGAKQITQQLVGPCILPWLLGEKPAATAASCRCISSRLPCHMHLSWLSADRDCPGCHAVEPSGSLLHHVVQVACHALDMKASEPLSL